MWKRLKMVIFEGISSARNANYKSTTRDMTSQSQLEVLRGQHR